MSHAHYDTKAARLYLNTPRGAIMLDGWPALHAVRADAQDHQAVRPQLSIRRVLQCCRDRGDPPEDDPGQLHLAFPKPSRFDAALRDYWASFPPAIVRTLLQFEGRHSFHLAQWCAAGGHGVLQRIPALGFAAALHAPTEHAQLARLNDLELTEALGFREPSAQVALKLLRQVPVASVGLFALRLLREVLVDDPGKRFRFYAAEWVPRLNLGVLRLVNLPVIDREIQAGLLEEVALSRLEDQVPHTALKLERIARYRAALGDEDLVMYDSIADVNEMLDELVALAGEMPRRLRRLPEPPLPGEREGAVLIAPIKTTAGLVFEGRILGNCAKELRCKVAAGELYFYRMLAPRRSTICLARSDPGTWRLEDVREQDNEIPRRSIVLLAGQWVASQQNLPLAEVFSDELREHLGEIHEDSSTG